MEPQPPVESAPSRRVSAPGWPLPLVMVLGAMVLLGLALLFLFDPARYALYPVCLFKKMTGYDCPGCGGLRALHQLLRGDVAQAIRLNAMVVAVLPVLGFAALRTWLKSRRRAVPGREFRPWAGLWLLIVLALLFGVVRNLSLWPFGVTPM